MPDFPDVLFDRYVRQNTPYCRGKHDLDKLAPGLHSLLNSIQQAFQHALDDELTDVPEHVEHSQFHLDYIDSDKLGALAFIHAGYSFIGLTIGLIARLAAVSRKTSETPSVVLALFADSVTNESREGTPRGESSACFRPLTRARG